MSSIGRASALPLEAVAAADRQPSGLAPPSNAEGSGAGCPGRALLFADDPAIVAELRQILIRYGYDVTTAFNGLQALAALRSGERFKVAPSDLPTADADSLFVLQASRSTDVDLATVFPASAESTESPPETAASSSLAEPMFPNSAFTGVDVAARAVERLRPRFERWETSRLSGEQSADRENGEGGVPHPWRKSGLEASFDSALAKLWMATQPIVSSSAKVVFAYEALLRTDEPAFRDPVDLFEAAELLGQTTKLGRAIRRRVADMLRASRPSWPMFVNVHPSDLEDPDLLSENGILTPFARQVVIEITERANLDQVDRVGARLARLRALGYRVALDDLGAGYAGLASLVHLEPDIVKVDMSLVRGLHKSLLKQKLFCTLASLCRDLGVKLIAEGVETSAERDCAVALGGDLFQGYLFGRPGPGFPAAQH